MKNDSKNKNLVFKGSSTSVFKIKNSYYESNRSNNENQATTNNNKLKITKFKIILPTLCWSKNKKKGFLK